LNCVKTHAHSLGVGMVLTEKKKLRLAEALARRQGAPTDVGPSIATPTDARPLVVAPHAQDSPNPPAVVVAIDSDDEVTGDGITFKRRRVSRPRTLPTKPLLPLTESTLLVLPLPTNHLLLKVVGRESLRVFWCRLLPSFLPLSNMPSKDFKRGGPRMSWVRVLWKSAWG